MRAVVQRVSEAAVSIDGKTVGKIGKGFMILLGVTEGDTPELCAYLAEKCAGLGRVQRQFSVPDAAACEHAERTLYTLGLPVLSGGAQKKEDNIK